MRLWAGADGLTGIRQDFVRILSAMLAPACHAPPSKKQAIEHRRLQHLKLAA